MATFQPTVAVPHLSGDDSLSLCEADADPTLIARRRVAVVGQDPQGSAHARCLCDSGVDVRVGVPAGSLWQAEAESAGLRVVTIDQAAAESDVVMMLMHDTEQAHVYASQVAPHLSAGDALLFAHGLNVRLGHITPPGGVDVALIRPLGHLEHREHAGSDRVPWFIAVVQDASGKARDLARSYARAVGAARAGIFEGGLREEVDFETTFREDADIDLFGERRSRVGF